MHRSCLCPRHKLKKCQWFVSLRSKMEETEHDMHEVPLAEARLEVSGGRSCRLAGGMCFFFGTKVFFLKTKDQSFFF